MNLETRYYFEQAFIPQSFFNKEVRLIMLTHLLIGGGSELSSLCNNFFEKAGERCPYKEVLFEVKSQVISAKGEDPEFVVMTLNMPLPEDIPLASRIFLCIDKENVHPACFMVELSLNYRYVLCGRDANGNHLNYGEAPKTEEE